MRALMWYSATGLSKYGIESEAVACTAFLNLKAFSPACRPTTDGRQTLSCTTGEGASAQALSWSRGLVCMSQQKTAQSQEDEREHLKRIEEKYQLRKEQLEEDIKQLQAGIYAASHAMCDGLE